MASRFYHKDLFPNETEEQRKERVAMSASYGHLTRQLNSGKPLTGKPLELALELVTPDQEAEDSKWTTEMNDMVKRLKAGEVLTDYQIHLLADVIIVHARIGRG